MAVRALWHNAVGGVPSYDAKALRQALSALMAPGAGPLRSRSGFRPGGAPVVSVTASTWSVGPFSGWIDTGQSSVTGPYLIASDATEQGSLTAAHSTYDRKDILYVQLDDADEADGTGQRRARVLYLAGTASATPTPPATPARSLRIGVIDVPKSGGGAPVFTPDRQYAVAAGGLLPVGSQVERDALSAYDGMRIWRADTGWEETRHGGQWLITGGRLPFRHLMKDPGVTTQQFSNASTIAITGMMVGPGDQGNGSGLTYSGGQVTITRSGLYRVDGQVGYSSNGSGYRQARLSIAGTVYRAQQPPTASGSSTVSIGREVAIDAGQRVWLEAHQTSGVTLDCLTGDFTFLSVRYLGPA